MSEPSKPSFLHRPNREPITREPDPGGRWSPRFPDMMGYRSQGGGKVPEDFGWKSSPKQWQEEMTPERLAEHHAQRVVPRTPLAPPALPEGGKAEGQG